MRFRNWALLVELVLFLAAPVVLMLLPPHTVEHGPTLCLFKLTTGHDCWGCGTTRAFSHLAHGNFAMAWNFNKLVIVTFPLVCWLWTAHTVSLLQRAKRMIVKDTQTAA